MSAATKTKRWVTLPSSPPDEPYLGRIMGASIDVATDGIALFVSIAVVKPAQSQRGNKMLSHMVRASDNQALSIVEFAEEVKKIGLTFEEIERGQISKLLRGRYVYFHFAEGADPEGLKYRIDIVGQAPKPAN